jgi:hypothetical protein
MVCHDLSTEEVKRYGNPFWIGWRARWPLTQSRDNRFWAVCRLDIPKRITDGHLSKLATANAAVLATFDENIPGSYLIPK